MKQSDANLNDSSKGAWAVDNTSQSLVGGAIGEGGVRTRDSLDVVDELSGGEVMSGAHWGQCAIPE